MATLKDFEHVKYVRRISATPNMYFERNQIYPIIESSDSGIVVIDETEEQSFIEGDELNDFEPVTDSDFKNHKKPSQTQIANQPLVNHNRPQIESTNRDFAVEINLNEQQFPYWAQYVVVNNEGVWATTNHPDEVSSIKEKVILDTPLVIKIPQKQKPFEILANLFKEGKITYEELESELKVIFKG